MAFAKADRFEKAVVCGPPPTAYNPKHLDANSAISFPKGERFSTPNGHASNEPGITRSHSSNSVGSTDSGLTSKYQGKKDHTHCNKQIAELEKELRSITFDRNQLLRRRNHPINKNSNPEGNKGKDPVGDLENEIAVLNQTIVDLQSKLDQAKNLEEEAAKLEDERDNALSLLESKQEEVARIQANIEELKTSFQQQENTLRSELEEVSKRAALDLESYNKRISELELKLENLENVRVELIKEIESTKSTHIEAIADIKSRHDAEINALSTLHGERVQQLENNLQQLAVEHDAESEQVKFDFTRQLEDIRTKNSAAQEKLSLEHSAELERMHADHLNQIHLMEKAQQELKTEKSRIVQKFDEANVLLETKLDEVETLKVELEMSKEKLESSHAQAEQRFLSMKSALELDIAELTTRYEEQHQREKESLCTRYDAEMGAISQTNIDLTEALREHQIQLTELETKHNNACMQYEEQLKRLNDNNQTEKEILLWQMNQQKETLEQDLTAEFESRMSSKNVELEKLSQDWEVKINNARQEHDVLMATLQTDHKMEIEKLKELQEHKLADLEREKQEILEERASLSKFLEEKETALVKVQTEMKNAIGKLNLELDMLKESNNQLVADLLRVEQENLLCQDRAETEKIELLALVEQEKKVLIQSHEVLIVSMQAKAEEKEQQLADLSRELSSEKETARMQLGKKEALLEELKIQLEGDVHRLDDQHTEELKKLRCDHEKMIVVKDEEFSSERAKLVAENQLAIDELERRGQAQSLQQQEEFRLSFRALEEKFSSEKEQLIAAYEEKLALADQHHQAVTVVLNRNYEEAADNVQELQQSLDELRKEFQEAISTADLKESQYQSDMERMKANIRMKEEELEKLAETIRLRDKQTADEWIQRETNLMTQFSGQSQQVAADCEARLSAMRSQLQIAQENFRQVEGERDAAREDLSVQQFQSDAQMAALQEQFDEERAMLLEKLAEQRQEISQIHANETSALQAQLALSQQTVKDLQEENARQFKELNAALFASVEPLNRELEALRKDHESFLLLQKEYQELQARIEPFRDQLEMYEAEKKALQSQAMTAESSMAALAAKYTQLLGHTNSKQKIHHLDKLKQDIFNLRKEVTEKNLALEKEKKARQKAEARVKELTGHKKYDPAEAFKVPENPSTPVVNKTARQSVVKSAITSSTTSTAGASEQAVSKERKPLRSQPSAFAQQSAGFFISMDDVEKTRTEMEKERQRRIETRRQASHNFDAFEIEINEGNTRRDTFDVPSKKPLNATHSVENKENSRSHGFPEDISSIAISDQSTPPFDKKLPAVGSSSHRTSTPLMPRHADE